MRTDGHLRYLYAGPKENRPGAPRKFDGRVDSRSFRNDVLTPYCQADDKSWVGDSAVVDTKSWKRSARAVIVHDLDEQGQIAGRRIYVSTDLALDGGE